jgi:hypothetical protein
MEMMKGDKWEQDKKDPASIEDETNRPTSFNVWI